MIYDYIIIGGGSAGSVLANRLSARSANRVLLLEAGQDTPPGQVPKEIEDTYPGTAYFDPRFHWTELKVHTQIVSHNNPNAERPPLRKYEQARVLGGGSSINGQMANRGAPTDYDEWESRGAEGWAWDKVLPYFKKVERDLDFDNEWHGKEGHIPVRRIPQAHWNPHAKAAAEAFKLAGFKYLPDQNGEFTDGYFPITISNAEEKRVSAAIGYLNTDVRRRNNLTISTETQARALIFEGTRCVGVTAVVKGREQEFRGREIILSCGAIHSPAHLLRAGIGPVGHLRDMGIPVLSALPGVGQRLMDHPSISLSSFIRPQARLRDSDPSRRHILVGLRYSSQIGGAPPGDMFVAVASKSAWHSVGVQIASMLAFVNKTYSETGQVRLASTDWREEPVVEFNLLSDRRDLDRLMACFKMLAAMQLSPPLAAVTTDPFPASYSDKVRQIGVVNEKNRWLTRGIAALLDGPAALRRFLIERYVVEGFTFQQVMSDDEALEAFIRKATIGVWHASCSCRMGREEDPMSVVDTSGRVKGVAGLRVVDASIFPVVPCANTNFPVLMTAEKVADAILAESRVMA
ncbi:GMC family oxidoreductase N-terminal domain-containing protein [Siccirubricoccus sp. KC 17139]|uniref:GMC family oxidoreductase N-terminal domain-containing protein n=1 Tax=Siccirubricoccus soli TaxID=2899147 RepID=A0ABT1D6L2_9PROT|nr:GMC family oxidoreductase N-terminal domain-containing protein [Siccirubricoccus soli]MCP2683718.1 GMC family oxidoreductase N-terminal domain-containing protein [Siccirubricoccus soli]